MTGFTVSDMFFGFLEDGEAVHGGFDGVESPESDLGLIDEEEEEGGGGGENDGEDSRSFWESQHQILQATLCRSSSLETKIRNSTKEALKEIQTMAGDGVCACRRPVAGGCRSCLMREVSGRLRNGGYNSAICKSKWRSSPDIPSGEHTFIDVIENASSRKKGEVRVIIELNFRAEFEMARASEDYNRLVRRLPEVFVGKVERLENVIKILCRAAKKCMKEKKMHMGPWRKQRYMQAKWLGSCERTTSMPLLSMVASSSSYSYSSYSGDRLSTKPRASMLTVDLLDKLPNMHCTAVEVL